jgi:hypothetical protein
MYFHATFVAIIETNLDMDATLPRPLCPLSNSSPMVSSSTARKPEATASLYTDSFVVISTILSDIPNMGWVDLKNQAPQMGPRVPEDAEEPGPRGVVKPHLDLAAA